LSLLISGPGLVAALAARLGSAGDADDVANVVADLAPRLVGTSGVLFAVARNGSLAVLRSVGLRPDAAAAIIRDGAAPGRGTTGDAAALDVHPLVADGVSLGVLAFGFDDPAAGSTVDPRTLGLVAELCAQALERIRLRDAERRARDGEHRAWAQATALAHLNAAVAGARTPDDVATILLDEMFGAADTSSTALALLEEGATAFRLVGVRTKGRHVDAQAHWPFEMPSPARDVVLSRQPMLISGTEYRGRYAEVSATSDPAGMEAYLALPLVVSGRAIGACGLAFESAPSLTDQDLAYLRAIVDAGAQAIARAWSEDAERRSRRLLGAVVDQMPLGVLVIEATTLRPLYANAAYHGLFGLPADGPVRREGSTQVLRADGTPLPLEERPFVRATTRGEIVTDEICVLERPDGRRVTITANAGPIRDDEGRNIAGVAVYADVTARHEAEAARDAFIGVLSHELRTPLTSIYGGAQVLLRPGRRMSTEARRDILNDVVAEAERLRAIVDDLLVLSRVERGVDLQRDEAVLLQRIAGRVAASEQSRWPGHTFVVAAPPSLPVVAGDEGYVEQILRNLLSNAAKYGSEDGRVDVVMAHEGSEVTVRVLDSGAGIPRGDEERIFRLFYRAASTAGSAAGAGIGLYAVRILAEAMGGRAWARNRLVGGAEVGFALPVLPVD
jgi:PAS domain S-box-containing protein